MLESLGLQRAWYYYLSSLELRLQEGEANRDIFWLKDDTLEDSADLPDPDVSVKIMRKKCKADSLSLQL